MTLSSQLVLDAAESGTRLGHLLERSMDVCLQLVRSSPLPRFQGIKLGAVMHEHLLPRAEGTKP